MPLKGHKGKNCVFIKRTDKMQPMEIKGTTAPEKDSKGKIFTVNRFLALMGIVTVLLVTFVFVIPDGEFVDEESSSIIEEKKKNLVPKVKAGERYPYEPDHWCLNVSDLLLDLLV